MKKYFRYALLIALVIVLILPVTAKAATTAEIQAQINAIMAQIQALQQQLAQLQAQQGTAVAWCHTFNTNLRIGDTGVDVRELAQAFVKEGITTNDRVHALLDEEASSWVVEFQQKYAKEILTPYGLKYGTGFVGKTTRAKLNKLYGCGDNVTPPPFVCAQVACASNQKTICPTGLDEKGCLMPCKCVPPTTDNQLPVISGVSGPTTLKINETGTWTVKASDPEQGALTYSVVWGDELIYGASTLAPKSTTYTQTATFTHSYSKAGIYNPSFTVTDDKGLSAKTSISVNVGDTTIIVPTLNVSLDASTPASANLSSGQTNITFAKIKLTAGADAVNSMNSIQIGSNSTNAQNFLNNFKIYDGATLLTSSTGDLIFNGDYYYQWLNVSGFSVPTFSSKILTVVADVKLAALAGSVRLGIAGWNFTSPGASVTPFGTAIYGNQMTIIPSTQPLITVTSPNGGETWKVGETHRISWISTGIQNVTMYLYDNRISGSGAIVNYPVPNNQPMSASQGYYDWTILPNVLQANDGKNFQIIIQDANNYQLSDKSNAAFSIVTATTVTPTLNVSLDSSTPAGGNVTPGRVNVPFAKIRLSTGANDVIVNSIQVGSDTPNASNYIQNIRVTDSSSGIQLGETAAYMTYNGSYYDQWIGVGAFTIPAYSSKTLTISADVRALADSGPIRLGILELNFTSSGTKASGMPVYGNIMTVISSKTPSISVFSPNGGEQWQVGSTQFIQWNVSDLTAKLEVGILSDRGYSTVLSNAITSCFDSKCGTYWTIPSTTIPGNYKVVVYLGTYTNYSVKDESNAAFSIVAASAINNTSLTVQRLFPGQYNNTKYNVITEDPDGIQKIIVKKANGSTLQTGNPPCSKKVETGTVDLLSSDFPLVASVNDCKDPTVVHITQVIMPPLPTTSGALAPSEQYSASMLENIKASLDQIQKLITNWNK